MVQVLRAYAKRELRQRMQSLRRVLPATARDERSARACARLGELPEFEAASVVAGYQPLRGELDPGAALARAAARGKRVVLPRMEADNLVFHLHVPGEPLVENAYGVLEPLESAPLVAPVEIGLVLVPALALDLRGFRLGYGKGFYDRALPHLPRAFTIGLAFDFQLLAEIPNEPHDVALHAVVTDERTERCER
jgi:5-formyltetrahydrofolate cyclo-ligase